MKKIFSLFLLCSIVSSLMAWDQLYLVGAGTKGNAWSNDRISMNKISDNEFETVVYLYTSGTDNGFKFVDDLESWGYQLMPGGDGATVDLVRNSVYDCYECRDYGWDRKFKVTEEGWYAIHVLKDESGIKVSTFPYALYPVGSGCEVGWNPGNKHWEETSFGSGKYTGQMELVSQDDGHEFKFMIAASWGANDKDDNWHDMAIYGPSETADGANVVSGLGIYSNLTFSAVDKKYWVSDEGWGIYDFILDIKDGKMHIGHILPSVTIRAQFASNVKTAYDNNFNLYYWTAMGAGNVTMTENEGWYEATMENVFAPYNFLFNKAADNWDIKTPDVTNNTASSLCMHVTNTGVLTATVSEGCEDLDDPTEPLVRPEVKLLGLNSWVIEEGYTMVEADDQMSCSYTATLTAGTHAFKIYTVNDEAYNGANYEIKRAYCTDIQLYSSGQEPNVQIKADMAGEYTFVYYYDTRKLNVIYPEIPESSNPVHYLKGIGGDWGGILMVPAVDDLTCSCTVTITANMIQTGWQNFKVFYKDEEENVHWLGGEVTLTRNAVSGTLEDNGEARNAYLLADFAGNYTFTYTYATQAISVSYPTLPEVDLKGINGDWSGVAMVDSADHLSCSYTYSLTAGKYEFKVFFNIGGEQWLGCGSNEDPAVMTRDNCSEFQFATGTENCQLKADKAGNYTFTYDYVSRKVSVTFPELQTMNVKLNEDGFASVYMPFDFTLPVGVEAYKGVLSGSEIVLTKVEQEVLPSETGLILYSETLSNVDITLTENVEGAVAVEDNSFIGTLEGTSESNVYVLGHTAEAHSTAFYYMESANIPANRAYLKTGGSGAPLRIRFATEVTTEMSNVNDNANVNKVIRDGRVYIVRENKVYTVMGQCVK